MNGWIAAAALVAINVLLNFFWKPYLQGYATKKGERLATSEDIEGVLREVRAVTRETASIQAEISGGLWMQQWHLGQRRDAYVRLIDALENIQVERDNIRNGDRAAKKRVRESIAEFRRARAIARLLLPSEVIESVGRLLRSIRKADPETCAAEEFSAATGLIEAARDRVVEIGKRDLRFSQALREGAI